MAYLASRQSTSPVKHDPFYRLPAAPGTPPPGREARVDTAHETRSATRDRADLAVVSSRAGSEEWIEAALPGLVAQCVGAGANRLEALMRRALRDLTESVQAADEAAVSELEATRTELERALEVARGDARSLRERLRGEYVEARRDVPAVPGVAGVVADSRAVQQALVQIQQVAPTSATVLLLGETGVGKEVFAEAIHEMSPRRRKPMVRVNCAAIPTALIESELFGRERGAYTGALSRQIGRFELAEGSTIFLDEIGELPLDVQSKLLRVLQNRVVERLGSCTPVPVNVRIIAATNRNLDQAIAERTFREDLYYRLNVFPVRVPALRERVEDIPALVWTFINEFAATCGKRIESLSRSSLHALQTYPWPGNVRELRNVVERAVILARGPDLVIELPSPARLTRPRSTRLIDVETDHIRAVLEATAWRVRGHGGAAELLGVKPTTLESRMAKLGIVRPTTGRARVMAEGGGGVDIE